MNASTKNARLSKTDLKKFHADERRQERKRLEDYDKLIAAFATFVAEHPRVEWEIVSNYCKRNNRILVQDPTERPLAPRVSRSKQSRPTRSL